MNIQIKALDETNYTFDDIHNLLWRANENNRNAGFVLKTAEISGEELKEKVGDGKCYVAIMDQELVGTITARVKEGRSWYYSGKYVSYMLAGVLPEFQGKHINTELAKKVFSYAEENGVPAVLLETASDNIHAIEVYKHQGFVLVDFRARSDTDHYHVVMIKWLKKQPYPNPYRIMRYYSKMLYVKMRYKPGKKKRLGL